ncbi:hypothetical protein OPT61_g5021 [Boeremia exigua]|uniref:Uncharacterized protein n=1 Tax=Boeremia exigua TaxID=749465 RepID=A0ACC2IBT7_9PLEO|nr:hypothetical protein OPT61_g5021 [Boeremia exigua]
MWFGCTSRNAGLAGHGYGPKQPDRQGGGQMEPEGGNDDVPSVQEHVFKGREDPDMVHAPHHPRLVPRASDGFAVLQQEAKVHARPRSPPTILCGRT